MASRAPRWRQLGRHGPVRLGLQPTDAPPAHVSHLVTANSRSRAHPRNARTPYLCSEFIPRLQAHAIPLPQTNPPFSFVIANTLVTSNKKLTAKYQYNLRVSARKCPTPAQGSYR